MLRLQHCSVSCENYEHVRESLYPWGLSRGMYLEPCHTRGDPLSSWVKVGEFRDTLGEGGGFRDTFGEEGGIHG